MKHTDLPARQALQQTIKDLDGQECRVGWFEGAKYENGTPVAYVASVQEFGHGPIPPRSFMRSTQAEKSEDWTRLVEVAARGIAQGKRTSADVFELLGAQAAGDVRAKIASITEPELKKSTLAARRQRGNSSTKPLVDERIMINTLTHQVTTK